MCLCEVYKKIPFMSNQPYQIVSHSKVIRMNSHARSALAVAKRRASKYNNNNKIQSKAGRQYSTIHGATYYNCKLSKCCNVSLINITYGDLKYTRNNRVILFVTLLETSLRT